MRDAEDFALHLSLAVGGDYGEPCLERLDYGAGVHAFRNGDGGGGGGWGRGREEREAKRDETGARCFRVDLRVVDEGDAALLEVATGLASNVIERCAETGDECNGWRVGALALDGVLALLA